MILNTGVMMLKIQLCITEIITYCNIFHNIAVFTVFLIKYMQRCQAQETSFKNNKILLMTNLFFLLSL